MSCCAHLASHQFAALSNLNPPFTAGCVRTHVHTTLHACAHTHRVFSSFLISHQVYLVLCCHHSTKVTETKTMQLHELEPVSTDDSFPLSPCCETQQLSCFTNQSTAFATLEDERQLLIRSSWTKLKRKDCWITWCECSSAACVATM